MIFNKRIKNFKWMLLSICTILLSNCHDYALINPKGQIGLEQKSLILTTSCLMLTVVIPVILMTIVFAWKYRASNKDARYNPDWSSSNMIETIIWIIPIIIILFLAVLAWKTTHSLEPSKPLVNVEEPLTIEVISMDWKWFFIYPKEKIATINELVFPINVPIHFKVTSNSVMNSFFIPRLGSQIYAMAGMQTNLYLIANKPGVYDGISASYSGLGFSGMKFKAIATSDYTTFDQWIKKVKMSPKIINDISIFENIAIPSMYNKVEYFSNVKFDLFKDVIGKFMN